MMQFKPVTLQDKDLINEYMKKQRVTSSELCFTTLYIWRRDFNIKYAVEAGCLVLMFKYKNCPASLRFPMGDGDKQKAVEAAFDYFDSAGESPRFYGLTEDMLPALEGIYPGQFDVTAMDDYFDYVYLTENLVKLSGKRYHSKKNHLNGFKKAYRYEFSEITAVDAEFIISGYDNWLDTNDPSLLSEQQSISELLRSFDKLDIFGGKITVDDQLCAFTLGERLNSDTAVVHIEKADTFFKGSYAAINQMFAENMLVDFKYVNREEDIGIEGLRKAKQSYHPEFMVPKYKALQKSAIKQTLVSPECAKA